MTSWLRQAGVTALLTWCGWSAIAIVIAFPWNTDPQADESATGAHADYYRRVYSPRAASPAPSAAADLVPLSAREQFYVDLARAAARNYGVREDVSAFVARYGLARAKVLDVGAGSGLLQDVLGDYTGLDISPSARRFFHKPFVEASATDMPFSPDSFDVAWSVWVLEHIPNPERALMEMRRVVKPGGYIYLWPAYDVGRYAAQGYAVRPYSSFDWAGKLVKATMPITGSNAVGYLYEPQIKALRLAATRLGSAPSRFRFIRLSPNYADYWVADSDATTSFTQFELHLWFASRGDRVLECPPPSQMVFRRYAVIPLIVQVQK